MNKLKQYLTTAYRYTLGHPITWTVSLSLLTAVLAAPTLPRWAMAIPLALLTVLTIRAQTRLAKFLLPPPGK